MFKKFIFLAIVSFSLSACQTTNIQSTEADAYRELIKKFCVVQMIGDASQIGGDTKIDDVLIYKIDKNAENWERVSFAATGLRDNFYLNKVKRKVYCNALDWREENPNVTFE